MKRRLDEREKPPEERGNQKQKTYHVDVPARPCDENDGEEEAARGPELPEELWSVILGKLPNGFSSIAARTCRLWWYRCLPAVLPMDKDERRCIVTSMSAVCSSINLLEWARQNGCSYWGDERLCSLMAGGGHLEVLRWAREKQCFPWNCYQSCCRAARGGHLDVLRWLLPQEQKRTFWDELYAEAAAGGHLDVLMWIQQEEGKEHCSWDELTCIGAARGGHLKVLQWVVKEAPYLWHERMLAMAAARGGQLEVLQWIWSHRKRMESNEEWDKAICVVAAERNDLKMLKWIVKNGCCGGWDGRTAEAAAALGHMDLLEWALQNGCPPVPPASSSLKKEFCLLKGYLGVPFVIAIRGYTEQITMEDALLTSAGGRLANVYIPSDFSEDLPGLFIYHGEGGAAAARQQMLRAGFVEQNWLREHVP
ncbi:Ankyrin repeat domain containing protein [Balamuthia mandrillaris]